MNEYKVTREQNKTKINNTITAIISLVVIVLLVAFIVGLLVLATFAVWRQIIIILEDINVLIAR